MPEPRASAEPLTSVDSETDASPPRSATKHSGLRHILLYGASRGTVEALLGLRGFVLAAILGPEAFGAWALFRLATRYAGLSAMGVHRGLEYEIVHARAAEDPADPRRAELAGRTALGFVLLVFGALAAVAIAGSFITDDARLAAGMRAFAAGTLSEQVWLYLVTSLRAHGELRRFAVNELWNAVAQLVLTSALATAVGLTGAYAGFVLAGVFSVILLAGRVPLRPGLSIERLRRLMRVGAPLALVLAATMMLNTADRFVVAAYGGTALLGQYAFAVAISRLATSAGMAVRTVIFPRVYERAAGAGAAAALREHIDRTLVPFAMLFPPLVGVAAIVIGPPVAMLVPQYLDAVAPARLFVFTGVTTGIVSLTSVGVVAAGRQRALPPFSLLAVLVNVALSTFAVRGGLGLPGVAAAALLSQAGFAAASLVIMARSGGLAGTGALLRRTLLPLSWCAAILFGLQQITGMLTPVSALAGAGAFLVLASPIYPAIIRAVRRARR